MAEAKSKLQNPGLVYTYHGCNRKRDPCILAQNAIVVTTYETLSSDKTYHANKAAEEVYCPPCEQVAWWRIICDESHVLRHENNGKSRAVMALVAENKWLVSGMLILIIIVQDPFFSSFPLRRGRYPYKYIHQGSTKPVQFLGDRLRRRCRGIRVQILRHSQFF